MHFHRLPSGLWANANGDFSGRVNIVVDQQPERLDTKNPPDAVGYGEVWECQVPFEDILYLVAVQHRSALIERIENASNHDLIRGKW